MSYRRNRGDFQSIREVFIDEGYRLPSHLKPRTLVDLGGNIGLTTLWYAYQHHLLRAVVVEPDPENVRLARLNLRDLDEVQVVQAAVGPINGEATFQRNRSSNLGRLDTSGAAGITVCVLTMPEILAEVGGHADLLKMDIEGGEEALLLSDDLSWLDSNAVQLGLSRLLRPFLRLSPLPR